MGAGGCAQQSAETDKRSRERTICQSLSLRRGPLESGKRLPDYKPVSVPLRATVIPLDRPLLTGSSDLPGSLAGRAVPPPLFGLAPRGVFPAGGITPAAVRSYRTISPLPQVSTRGGIFSVALSVKTPLRGPPRPLAGTLPCGDRTFLPLARAAIHPAPASFSFACSGC